MTGVLGKLAGRFSRKDKRNFMILLFLLLIAANLELLGIGLVLPVIAMLTNPALIRQNRYLSVCYDILNPSSPESFLFILCIVIAAVYLLKNVYLALVTYWQSYLINSKVNELRLELYCTYIHAPYEFFLERSLSDLQTSLSLVESWLRTSLVSVMMILTELFNVFFIFMLLFFFVPGATFLLIAVSLILSAFIYFPLRKINTRLGKDQIDCQSALGANCHQGFGGIKEVKIRKSEDFFVDREKILIRKNGTVMNHIQLLGQIPRFLLESGMVCGGMILLAIYLLTGTASTSIILKLTLIGTAIVRLMPALSRIQYNLASLRQAHESLEKFFSEVESIPSEAVLSDNGKELTLRENIVLSHVSFSYKNGSTGVLDDVSLTIPVNTSAAFVGRTGCGKTTLVDLIAGLLTPASGKILADGVDIRSNLSSWRSRIGYVSQNIYVMDDTILANVTLGTVPDQVDEDHVWKCLQIAQLDGFVRSLPSGLHTHVGDRGCRLSGGQRQRVGIARALYSKPSVLILDEATSALDTETEAAFMDAVSALHGKLTLFIVAHRLSTTQGCDQVIDLGKGKNS